MIRLDINLGGSPRAVGRRLVLNYLLEDLESMDETRMFSRRRYAVSTACLGLNSEEASLLLGMEPVDYERWLAEEHLEALATDEEILELTIALNQLFADLGRELGYKWLYLPNLFLDAREIGRASCRERV